MKHLGALSLVVFALAVAGRALAYDPEPQPSPWGPQDEAGNSNTQTAAKVLDAKELIKTGKKYLLGHVYESTMPLFPGNVHAHVSKPPVTVGRQTANTELIIGDIGQNGTQFDAFGHFSIQPENNPLFTAALFYNRFTGAQVYSPLGLQKLGVEKMKPFFTRGILIDVKRYVNGGETLSPGEEITVGMAQAALAAQGMDEDVIAEGDVVLFVTGWEEHWGDGTLVYYAGAPGIPGGTPGIGLGVATWLAAKRVACVGADNWGLEVFPNPDPPPDVSAPVHNELIIKNGIPQQESMSLAELANDLATDLAAAQAEGEDSIEIPKIYQFAYIFVPVPLKGASGSPGIPMAVR